MRNKNKIKVSTSTQFLKASNKKTKVGNPVSALMTEILQIIQMKSRFKLQN